ncbi:hypothetical protein SLS60_004719 [Paraconiothyrium brasiliense]|uniref:DUF4150 domain-containing protein n=1 Tax=Paraconiothyrium brasiliense TaxID=300254 RepID=A0ABR3RL74_9PLEO
MGNSSSHHQAPPLIALHGGAFGKQNTILVPGGACTGRWDKFPRNKKSRGRPNYQAIYPPPSAYPPPWQRTGRSRRRGKGWGVRNEDTLSDGDMRPRRGARRGMGMPMAYPGTPMGHPGMNGVVPGMPIYYDPRGMKAMSAPNLQAAYMPPVRGGKVKNMGMQPGVMPGYAPMPGPTPYAYPQPMVAPLQAQAAAQPEMPAQAPRHQKTRPLGVEATAQGAYHTQPGPQAPGRRREPPVSAQMNRTQPANKRAGPSEQEWIPGESAFLDACTCTTNCTCRKGARVLYRHQGQGDEEQNTWGEIRYVMKDDLGRDCGDHGRRCEEDESDGPDGARQQRGKGKRKNKKGGEVVEKMREEMKGLMEDIKNLRVEGGKLGMNAMGRGAIDPMVVGTMPNQHGFGMMNGMDPRVAQQMGAGDPYGLGFLPQMQRRMMGGRPGQRRGGGMPGMVDTDVEDDLSFEDADGMMEPRMGSSMMNMPPGMMRMGPKRMKQPRGPRARPPRRAQDFDPRYEYPPPPGRRPHPRQRGGPAPRPPGYDLDEDSMGSGLDGQGRFGPAVDDEGDWGPGGHRPGKLSSD